MNIFTYKAQPHGLSDPTEDVFIVIDKPVPEFETLGEQDDTFMAHAKRIEKALYDSLPGGLYDRLLGEMLWRKATHFRVAHTPTEPAA